MILSFCSGKTLAGLWIVKDQELFYNQLSHITFMCPMRFNKFPLDNHICSFWVGSTNFDETKMTFGLSRLTTFKSQNPVLDYFAEIEEIPERFNLQLLTIKYFIYCFLARKY